MDVSLRNSLKNAKASMRRLMTIDKESEGTIILDSLHIIDEFDCLGFLMLGMLLLACPL